MRNNISQEFIDALQRNPLKFFVVVGIFIDSGTLWFSSFARPFVCDDIYIRGGADLQAVDTPRVSSSVDKEKFRVVFSGRDSIPLLEQKSNLSGRELEVWVGYHDEDGIPVNDSFNKMMLAYRGGIDQNAIQNDFESIRVMITGTSPLVNLDQRGGYPVSKDGMDQINTNDTSFDFLYKGSSKTLEWGKS